MGTIMRNGHTFGGGNLTNITNEITIEPTDVFHVDGPGYHNSIFRGKNLGTAITSEQLQAIRDWSFRDLFIGDYWTSGKGLATSYFIIAGCNLYEGKYSSDAESSTNTTAHDCVNVKHLTIYALLRNSDEVKFDGSDQMYATSSVRNYLNDKTSSSSPISKAISIFGEENILKHCTFVPTSAEDANTAEDYQPIRLMSEVNCSRTAVADFSVQEPFFPLFEKAGYYKRMYPYMKNFYSSDIFGWLRDYSSVGGTRILTLDANGDIALHEPSEYGYTPFVFEVYAK